MGRRRRKRREQEALPADNSLARAVNGKAARNCAVAFLVGAVLAAGVTSLVVGHDRQAPSPSANKLTQTEDLAGKRTVAQLAALTDDELETVDIVEMNLAVAVEIPGLEKLDYGKYRRIVDDWTAGFRRWLPTVEHAFHDRPTAYENDIDFFRLGMLSQFLDRQVGIAYVEEQKRAVVEAKNRGEKLQIAYTNPGDLLLHGLIDTKRGTCGTMPTLHVAIGRRLGWPVGLACVDSHYVCRYDDGKIAYNIEATDTGRGGFSAGTDQQYLDKKDVSRKAVAVGSDLRKLSAGEMLGVFVQARARHFTDTGKPRAAARDYALAHTLFPNSRKIYIGLVGNLVPLGEKLFTSVEHGHPASLAAHLGRRYGRGPKRSSFADIVSSHDAVIAEVDRINAINRANRERLLMPATGLPPQQQPTPDFPTHQPPMPGHSIPTHPF